MKKITSLIMVALMVTIGGVYATWNYAQGNTASIDSTHAVDLSGESVDGEKGKFSITQNGVKMIIDQATDGSYNAILKLDGSFDVTFTPNPGADVDLTEVDAYYVVEVTTTQYNSVDILTSTKQGTQTSIGKVGSTPVSINTSDLGLVLGSINLPDKDAYDAFETALTGTKVRVIIYEGTVA